MSQDKPGDLLVNILALLPTDTNELKESEENLLAMQRSATIRFARQGFMVVSIPTTKTPVKVFDSIEFSTILTNALVDIIFQYEKMLEQPEKHEMSAEDSMGLKKSISMNPMVLLRIKEIFGNPKSRGGSVPEYNADDENEDDDESYEGSEYEDEDPEFPDNAGDSYVSDVDDEEWGEE